MVRRACTMVGMRRFRWNTAAPASELGSGIDQLGQQAIDAHLDGCTGARVARVHGCTGTRTHAKGGPPLV